MFVCSVVNEIDNSCTEWTPFEEVVFSLVTASEIAEVFAWGFMSVLSFWAFGYAVGILLKFVRAV